MRIAQTHVIFPRSLVLTGVICTDKNRQDFGSFGDIYQGSYSGSLVALKAVRKKRRSNENGSDYEERKVRRSSCKVMRRSNKDTCTVIHSRIPPLSGLNAQEYHQVLRSGR